MYYTSLCCVNNQISNIITSGYRDKNVQNVNQHIHNYTESFYHFI